MNQNFQDYLKKEGISHQLTEPYSPQPNGVAERRNRYLLEMVRSMLENASLGQKYWGVALMTAAYLQNNLLSSTCPKTPYELWNNKKPDVSKLKVFGSKAFYFVPHEKRTKLDNRAKEGIFVGYSSESKGYLILNPQTDKLITARTVDIIESDENSFLQNPNDSLTSENERRVFPRSNNGIAPERFTKAYNVMSDIEETLGANTIISEK